MSYCGGPDRPMVRIDSRLARGTMQPQPDTAEFGLDQSSPGYFPFGRLYRRRVYRCNPADVAAVVAKLHRAILTCSQHYAHERRA